MDRSGHVGHILVDGDRLDELAAPRRTGHVRRLRRRAQYRRRKVTRYACRHRHRNTVHSFDRRPGTVSGGIVRRLLQWGGIPSSSLSGTVLLVMTGFGTGVALNFALFMLLLRVVSHIKAGRFTILGALLGSLTVSAMQLLGARLLAGASRNPMLAPFAALIGVLIWFNLVAQVILLCAALIAECQTKELSV